MSYYEGDAWSNHVLNEIKCAECLEYFDQQEKEGGNVCQPCLDKCYGEGESMNEYTMVFTATIKADDIEGAIERARANYGNEVADYGVFTLEGESK